MATDAKVQSPGNFIAVFKYLLIAFVGYLAAVVIATLATMFIVTLIAMLIHGPLNALGTEFGFQFMIGSVLTFIFASPGFITTLILAKIEAWHRWRSFALAGIFTAFFAFVLLGMVFDLSWDALIMFCIMAGGFAGGATYFQVTKRFLYTRQENACVS